MIAEAGIALTLITAGGLLLMPWAKDVTAPMRACLAFPLGLGAYLVVALGMVVTVGTLDPPLALGLTAVAGIAGFAYGGLRAWSSRDVLWLLAAVAAGLVMVIIARLIHFTRLTPDSLRYLLASNDLVVPDALAAFHPSDLHERSLGLPALHALSDLTDRRYLATIGPLMGLSGFGLFLGVAWQATRRMANSSRVLLVVTALAFLITSNRLIYDAFYINTHIFVAVFVLVTMTGMWQAVTCGMKGWAFPAGLALSVTLLLRPEAPLLVALILVVVAASRADLAARLWLSVPSLVVLAVWYGTLWQHSPGGEQVALDAPIFGAIAAVLGSAVVLFAARVPSLERWGRRVDLVLIGGLAAVLAVFVAVEPATFTASADATFRNVVLLEGHWQVTWPAVTSMVAVALLIGRDPSLRLWVVPVVGYGLLWWLLPFLRDGPWRVGTGDSGNRILAHILFPAVVYVVLAVASTNPASSQREELAPLDSGGSDHRHAGLL